MCITISNACYRLTPFIFVFLIVTISKLYANKYNNYLGTLMTEKMLHSEFLETSQSPLFIILAQFYTLSHQTLNLNFFLNYFLLFILKPFILSPNFFLCKTSKHSQISVMISAHQAVCVQITILLLSLYYF